MFHLWRTSSLVLALLAMSVCHASSGPDKCDDPESLKGWSELRDMRPDDPGKPFVEELWTLRLRLCSDLKAGRVSRELAHEQFETERERIYNKWRKALDDDPRFEREAT